MKERWLLHDVIYSSIRLLDSATLTLDEGSSDKQRKMEWNNALSQSSSLGSMLKINFRVQGGKNCHPFAYRLGVERREVKMSRACKYQNDRVHRNDKWPQRGSNGNYWRGSFEWNEAAPKHTQHPPPTGQTCTLTRVNSSWDIVRQMAERSGRKQSHTYIPMLWILPVHWTIWFRTRRQSSFAYTLLTDKNLI